MPRFGTHAGRALVQSSSKESVGDHVEWIALYAAESFLHIPGLVIIYLTFFLATYRRAVTYVGPSSQVWFVKKIVDGVFLGIWTLLSAVEIAWILTGYVAYYINGTLSNDDYAKRQSTNHSLDLANGSFYILTHIGAIAGIAMLKRASTSQEPQDSVVQALTDGMIALILRAIWTVIITVTHNIPQVFQNVSQSDAINLADAIVNPLFLVALIRILIHLGSPEDTAWDVPPGVAPLEWSTHQFPFADENTLPAQQDGTDNVLATQQHPEQQEFAHLPQPPAGYFYRPPPTITDPVPDIEPAPQVFRPDLQQQPSASAPEGPGPLQPAPDSHDQPNVNKLPQSQAYLNSRVSESPVAGPSQERNEWTENMRERTLELDSIPTKRKD